MDKDEEIRFRVTSESFVDTSPSAPDAKGKLTKFHRLDTYEFPILGCFGQSGLQREKKSKLP